MLQIISNNALVTKLCLTLESYGEDLLAPTKLIFLSICVYDII